MSADLRNSLFALAAVLVLMGIMFLGEKYAVPAMLISAALSLTVAGARGWVVRQNKIAGPGQ